MSKEEYLKFIRTWKNAAQTKQLTAAHFILLNVIKGRDLMTGFSPKNKCPHDPWAKYNYALWEIKYIIRLCKEGQSDHYRIKNFFEPFNGGFTPADLAKVEIEENRVAA